VVVAGLTVAVWSEGLGQGGARLDKKVLTDRSSQERLDDWQVGCVASFSAEKESNTARDQGRLLRGAISHRTKHGQSQYSDPDHPDLLEERSTKY
jgi:hypothetical protein